MFKEYFSHDYNARLDFKVRTLRARMGFEGYGLFWMLIEELYCNDGALPLDGIEVLAKCYNVRASKLLSVVMDFGLFVVDEEAGTFSSHRVGETLSRRKAAVEERKVSAANRSAAAKTAAATRWGARGLPQCEDDAEVTLPQCGDDAEVTRTQCGDDAEVTRTQCGDDADAMRTQCGDDANKRKEEKRKEKKTTSTPSSSATRDGRPSSRKGAEAAPAPSAPPKGATEEDIGAEIRELLGNESVQYQIAQKSGFRDIPAVEGYIAEFAGQLALEGKGGEHGMRLALHFAYWLAKKRERQLKTNGQAGNHGNQDIGGNNGDGAVADPAALLGWQYPAAAYGVKPTDAEIREELRHRNVLQGAYNLLMGSSPGR